MKDPKHRIEQIMELIRVAKSESLDPESGVDGWGFWRTQCSRYGDMIEMQVDELLTAGLAHPAAASMTDDQVNAEVAVAAQLMWLKLLKRQAARDTETSVQPHE